MSTLSLAIRLSTWNLVMPKRVSANFQTLKSWRFVSVAAGIQNLGPYLKFVKCMLILFGLSQVHQRHATLS